MILSILSFLSFVSLSFSVEFERAIAYSYNNSFPIPSSNELDLIGRNGWVSYKQCDSAWANQQLGTCKLTICSAGCAMRFLFFFFNFNSLIFDLFFSF